MRVHFVLRFAVGLSSLKSCPCARQRRRFRIVPPKGHRKSKALRKERVLLVRLSEAQWTLISQASKAASITVSSWARQVLVELALEELKVKE